MQKTTLEVELGESPEKLDAQRQQKQEIEMLSVSSVKHERAAESKRECVKFLS